MSNISLNKAEELIHTEFQKIRFEVQVDVKYILE